MSDLLNSASLVMIPSGYKEDVVYSEVPTNGNGDLSFTRASDGTRVNSAGLVEVVAWNLLKYSEDFSSSDWNKGNLTITTDSTTAPNGTTTADKAIPNTTNAAHGLENTSYLDLTIGQTYTASFYAKASGYNFIQFLADGGDISGNPRANFNLSNGTLGSVDTGLTASIESVGNSWYKCVVSFVVAYNIFNMGLYVSDSGTASRPPVFTGDGTSGAFIWGAQANIGSTAKPYFPTTDRLNVPRLTYQNGGGGCPSLLLEKQSTNLATYSEQIDNAVWTKGNATVNANVSASPDGTSNADKVIPSTSVAFHNVTNSLILTIGTVYTISAFAKADGYNYVAIGNGFGTRQALFNLSNGDITTVTSSTTAEIKNYGNGWYRCSITFETTNTANQLQITVDNGSNAQYAGNGTSGAFIWGTSVEIGSYPTSYIPTTSSSATRVADVCSKTGISSLIGQTEGVIFIDYNYDAKPDVNGNLPMVIYDGSNEAYIFITGAGSVRLELYDGGVLQCLLTTSIGAVGRKKIAFAYKQNDFVGYMNGVQVATDTSGTVGAMSNLYVGSYYTANFNANGGINQAILFKTRLSNSELASLTTI